MTPELRQLRYFVAVAEEGNLTRAAGRLHIAQQSLSQQIRALETQLGVTLFERTTRGVSLTEPGEVLLRDARPVLAGAERAVESVRRAAHGEPAELRVGVLASVANHLMPPVVRAFAERYPSIDLITEDVTIAALVERLRAGTLDAGLSRPPLVDDLETELILREPVAAVLPEGHPLADRDQLEMADLADEDWVLTPRESWPPWHRFYDEEYAAAGYRPRVVRRGSSVQNLLALVAAGVGVTRLAISARTLRDSGVCFVPIVGQEAWTVVVWRPDASHPALPALREVARDVTRSTDLSATG